MPDDFQPPPHSWLRKFARASWGIGHSMRTQSSCYIHAAMTLLVIAAGLFFRVSLVEWCLLALSIGSVWSAELMNTALERLARQVDRRHNLELGQALDIASGAVLCMALGAAAVGLMVFGPHIWTMLT